jgi:hypothetical protein
VSAALVALALVLHHRGTHLAGTDSVFPRLVIGELRPTSEVCQPTELPAGADRVVTRLGTEGHFGPAMTLTVRNARSTVLEAPLPRGYLTGDVSIAIPRVRELVSGADVCLRNLGPTSVLLTGGDPGRGPDPIFDAKLDGHPLASALALQFYLPGRRSWFRLGTTIARRYALIGPSWVGTWTLWTLAGLVAAMWAIAVVFIVRDTGARR